MEKSLILSVSPQKKKMFNFLSPSGGENHNNNNKNIQTKKPPLTLTFSRQLNCSFENVISGGWC